MGRVALLLLVCVAARVAAAVVSDGESFFALLLRILQYIVITNTSIRCVLAHVLRSSNLSLRMHIVLYGRSLLHIIAIRIRHTTEVSISSLHPYVVDRLAEQARVPHGAPVYEFSEGDGLSSGIAVQNLVR
jgi:hypothetical protein